MWTANAHKDMQSFLQYWYNGLRNSCQHQQTINCQYCMIAGSNLSASAQWKTEGKAIFAGLRNSSIVIQARRMRTVASPAMAYHLLRNMRTWRIKVDECGDRCADTGSLRSNCESMQSRKASCALAALDHAATSCTLPRCNKAVAFLASKSATRCCAPALPCAATSAQRRCAAAPCTGCNCRACVWRKSCLALPQAAARRTHDSSFAMQT